MSPGKPGSTPPFAPAGTRLVRHLGAGSTFEVAIVERAGTELVAKRVRAALRSSDVAQAALEREAATLALLPVGLAPALIERGVDPLGPFVLEELVVGRSLRAAAGATLGERAALARGAAALLARVQQATDERGPLAVVHGDPTPDHFVLRASGALSMLDLGASSSRERPEPSPGRGTLPFVAPELCRGETGATAATDRYATVVVLAQLLTGERLVRAETQAAMLLEIGDRGHDVARLAALPDPLRAALSRHLALEPDRRPETLDDLADPSLYDALDARARS